LTQGQTYKLRLQAQNAYGYSSVSNLVSILTA